MEAEFFYDNHGQKIDLGKKVKLPDDIGNDIAGYEKRELTERVKYLEQKNKKLNQQNIDLQCKVSRYMQTLADFCEFYNKVKQTK